MTWVLLSIGTLIAAGVTLYAVRELLHLRRVDSLAQYELPESSPSRITLEPCEQYGWLVEPEVQHTLRQLEELGFMQAGTFKVVEMSGLHIVGLTHPRRNVIASVYADSRGITWVDMSAMSEQGEVFTTSNSLNEELLQVEPRDSLRVDKSWSVTELFAQQIELCDGERLRAVEGLAFDTLFARSYEHEMAQLNENGGVLSEAAFRLQNFDDEIDEEEFHELYNAYVYRCGVLRLHQECCDEFRLENGDAAETLIAVHEHIPPHLLLPFILEQLDLADEYQSMVLDQLDFELNPRENFRRINELMPSDLQVEHCGEVLLPVNADVYRRRAISA